MHSSRFLFIASCSVLLAACGGDDTTPADAGSDTGVGGDSGARDAGRRDGGPRRDGGSTACMTGCEWQEVQPGLTHTCARRDNGSMMCWGGNVEGQLGDGSERHGLDCGSAGSTEPQDCSPPVVVAVVEDATELTTRGGLSSCALRESGEVWCWGLQSVPPAVGSDSLPERLVPELREGFTGMTQVSDGWVHLCAVGAAGAITCIGNNDSGQIGNGDTMEARVAQTLASPTGFVEIQTGVMGDITCGRTGSDEVWCWGNNADTALGDGVADHADDCMTMLGSYDCSQVPVQVMVPPKTTFAALTVGSAHVCALDSEGFVWCWGSNNHGQLGVGDQTNRDLPTPVPGLSNVVQISAGAFFTCALAADGAIFCFGDNREGSLGDDVPAHTGCASPMATDCSVSPVQVSGIDDARYVGGGLQHACAIRDTNEIWCWGYNTRRQLGDGTRERRFAPVQVQGLD